MLRLMVVDDAREDLMLLARHLQQCRILNPVSLFTSAAECMNYFKLRQITSNFEPTLMFLDLVMGPQSGMDVLRFLKSRVDTSGILVIMISGMKDIRAINEGYQLGAKTFLLKPVTAREIVEVLNSLRGEIVIQEEPGGYTLHWKAHLSDEHHDNLRRTGKLASLSV
jgi:response regulator RpfG family c-di-GMP phosphodiesterase